MKKFGNFLICFVLFSSFHLLSKTHIRSLNDASSIPLVQILQRKKLLILFKSNCSTCLKQVKNLECFEQKDIVLIGGFSDQKLLQRDYIKMKSDYSVFYADQDIFRFLHIDSEVTPQIIIYQGGKLRKFTGYHPCQKIKKEFDSID